MTMNAPIKYTQFRPLKSTDVLPSLWLRDKDAPNEFHMVIAADTSGVSIVQRDEIRFITYSGLASMYSKWEMSKDGGRTWVAPKIGCIAKPQNDPS